MAKRKSTAPANKRLPAGFKIRVIEKELRLPDSLGGPGLYELHEVSGVKVPAPRYFISDEAARAWVAKAEAVIVAGKAIRSKKAPAGMAGVVKTTREMAAATELFADLTGGPKSDRKEAKVMYSDSE